MALSDQDFTDTLAKAGLGDAEATGQLVTLLYDQLRATAARQLEDERTGHTLQPTALVHEAYLRLIGDANPGWSSKGHFFAAAAQAMRRVLVDYARSQLTLKRGGGREKRLLDDVAEPDWLHESHIIAVDGALNTLAQINQRRSQVVELHFFAGLTFDEAAKVMGVSSRTVYREWQTAKAWLHRELARSEP